jgi:hypothetical protein
MACKCRRLNLQNLVLLGVVLRWLWLLREWRVEVLEYFCVDDIERHGEARRLVGQRGVDD